MVQPRRAKTSTRDPYSTKHSSNIGDRIPHADKVAQEDSARAHILITLHRMEQAGVAIDERAVEIATKLGRWHHQEGQGEGARSDEDLRHRVDEVDEQRRVYYARCGHLIKIGTTMDLASRFRSVRPNELLAVEPGGQETETLRHRQFEALRASGEYFHPGPALQQHIIGLRTAHGAPTVVTSLVPDGQDFFPRDLDC